MRDLADSLERETDLKEQLKYAEEVYKKITIFKNEVQDHATTIIVIKFVAG